MNSAATICPQPKGNALLRHQLRATVEDIKDARIIERAKKAHGKQPRIPWSQAKKELGLP